MRVVTLWFRAPELLYGMRNYDAAIDCWSLGCVFAEMILNKGRALFDGHKEHDQIQLIYEKCGWPTEDTWGGVSKLRFYNEFQPRVNKANIRSLKEDLKRDTQNKFPDSLYDLIDRLLVLNPAKRLTVE